MKFRVIIVLILCSLGTYVQGMENEQRETEKQVLPLRKKWWSRELAFNGTPPSLSSLVLIELACRASNKQLEKLPQELQEQVALLKEGKNYLYYSSEKPVKFKWKAVHYPVVIEALIALSDKKEMQYWLHAASEEVALPLLEMFCAKGINWNEECRVDPSDNRSLHILVQSFEIGDENKLNSGDIVEAIDLLIKSGADVNCKNAYGYTPLHIAAGTFMPFLTQRMLKFAKLKEISLPVVEYLVEHGADVNLQDNSGETPLHEAVCSLNRSGIKGAEIIKYLLANGAQTGIKIFNGNFKDCTPRDMAQRLLANEAALAPEKREAFLNVIQLLEAQDQKSAKKKDIF
jgi:ankyrin repeat protein